MACNGPTRTIYSKKGQAKPVAKRHNERNNITRSRSRGKTYLVMRARVATRVRGKPFQHPVHLQDPKSALAVAAQIAPGVRWIPERVPAKRHENHRDVEVFLSEARQQIVAPGSGSACRSSHTNVMWEGSVVWIRTDSLVRITCGSLYPGKTG